MEVILAVGIILMVSVSMFRFLDTDLKAISISSEQNAKNESIRALASMLQGQMNDLPPSLPGAILGESHTLQQMASDELSWKCQAGNGLFTARAAGEYTATLAIRQDSQTNQSRLSLRRARDESGTVQTETRLGDIDQHWLDLMDGVDGFEARYFDSRVGQWVERWTDQQARPALVRVRIWRDKHPEAYETILTLPLAQAPTG